MLPLIFCRGLEENDQRKIKETSLCMVVLCLQKNNSKNLDSYKTDVVFTKIDFQHVSISLPCRSVKLTYTACITSPCVLTTTFAAKIK